MKLVAAQLARGVAGAGFGLLMAVSVPPCGAVGLHGEAKVEYVSEYISTGWKLSGDPCLQPGVTLEPFTPDIQLMYWGSYPLRASTSDSLEHDFVVRLSHTFLPERRGAFRLQGYADYWSFPRVVPLPPDAVLLKATNGASGGAFTGDYVRAGIELAGFRFRADNAVPASLLIQLRSGSQFYSSAQLNTQVLQTGAWYEVWTRVGSAEWLGPSSVLTNVQEFAVYIRPASSEAETCRVDNAFIEVLPSGDVRRAPEGTSLLTWSHLRTGWHYRVQVCGDLLAGGWSNTAAFTSTGASEQLTVTNVGERSAWRLSN